MPDKAAELRAALVEMAVEEDDALMEAYLEAGKEPSEDDLQNAASARAPWRSSSCR